MPMRTPKKEDKGTIETRHLLRSPANAARLLRSIEDADEGKVVKRALIEDEPGSDT